MPHHILLIGENVEQHEAHFASEFVVHRLSDKPDRNAYLVENGDKIEALCLSGGADPRGDKALLDRLPNLSLVATFGVGVAVGGGIVDLAEVKARGIVATYGPGSNSVAVADLALGFMLALTRDIGRFDRFTRDGQWAKTGSKGGYTTTISSKPVGILGLGNIGAAVARRCAAFDMPVFYHQRHRDAAVPYTYCPTLRELAAACRYLIVCVPDSPQTKGMVDGDVLAALGPDGYLVNIARGAVVDEGALIAALQSRSIAGAGLDVFQNEPNVNADFFALDNVILSPHRAAFTEDSTRRMRDMMMENLLAHFAGRAVPNPIPGFEEIARGRR